LRITVAVAGFKKNELDVSLEGNQLQIRGNKKEDERERIFIHRGIATRQFQRNFVLADGIEVKEASMDDGLLFVDLTQHINNDQSVKIEIKDTKKKKKANLISLGNEHNNT
jgi:HSP20 family molecular chaperone IbpA